MRSSARTIAVVARRELREQLHSTMVWMLVAVALSLAALAGHLGGRRLAMANAVHAALLEQRSHERARAGGQLTGWQMEPALRAIRTTEPLAVLVRGLDAEMPQYWDLGPAGPRQGIAMVESTSFPRADIDLEFIIRVVLGLLAIALAVETVAGQRASGALLALLGQPVRPQCVLAGKLLGTGVTLAGALALTWTASLAAMAAGPGRAAVDARFVGGAALIGAIGALYLFVCLVFGIAVASVVRMYHVTFVAAVVIWLTAAVVALPAAVLVGQVLVPTAAAVLVEEESERLVAEWRADAQAALGDAYAARLGGPSQWMGRQADRTLVGSVEHDIGVRWRDQVAATLRPRLRALDERTSAARAKQRTAIRVLAALSPGAQFTIAAANIAGTGAAAAARWDAAVRTYADDLTARLFDDPPRIVIQVPGAARGSVPDRRSLLGFNLRPLPTVDAVPQFAPPDATLHSRSSDTSQAVLALLVFAAALTAAAAWTFSRVAF